MCLTDIHCKSMIADSILYHMQDELEVLYFAAVATAYTCMLCQLLDFGFTVSIHIFAAFIEGWVDKSD